MSEAMKLPPTGTRVVVIRYDGSRLIARRDCKPDANFRDPNSLQWLNDDDKFIDVPFNKVVAWSHIDETVCEHDCEVCGKALDPTLLLLTVCRRCLELRDILMPLMRNEQAKAFLIAQCLDADTADSIVDMDGVRDKIGVGPRTNPRRKAWRKLAQLARKVAGR